MNREIQMISALRAVATVLLLSLASVTALSQQQAVPIERPPLAANAPTIRTLRIDSQLVSVALNVTDEHGAYYANPTH